MKGPQNILSAPDMLQEMGALGGYAYGNYMSTCCKCGRFFMGDKRATECFSCAVGTLQTQVAEMHSNRELLYDSYLGIIVLRAMCRRAKLEAGETRCDELLEDIGKQHPEFAARSAMR